MQQGLQRERQPVSSPENPHRRTTIRMQLLQEEIHDNRQPQRPREKAPEGQTLRLQRVKGLQCKILPEVPADQAHRAEAQTARWQDQPVRGLACEASEEGGCVLPLGEETDVLHAPRPPNQGLLLRGSLRIIF